MERAIHWAQALPLETSSCSLMLEHVPLQLFQQAGFGYRSSTSQESNPSFYFLLLLAYIDLIAPGIFCPARTHHMAVLSQQRKIKNPQINRNYINPMRVANCRLTRSNQPHHWHLRRTNGTDDEKQVVHHCMKLYRKKSWNHDMHVRHLECQCFI